MWSDYYYVAGALIVFGPVFGGWLTWRIYRIVGRSALRPSRVNGVFVACALVGTLMLVAAGHTVILGGVVSHLDPEPRHIDGSSVTINGHTVGVPERFFRTLSVGDEARCRVHVITRVVHRYVGLCKPLR